jgi:hypothetical protein
MVDTSGGTHWSRCSARSRFLPVQILSWHEYYTKEPSSDMRLLTKHELKKIERYVAKDEHVIL